MNIVQRAAQWIATRAQAFTGLPLRDPSVSTLFGYVDAASGVAVTEWTALTYSAYWLAVNIISDALTVPVNHMECIDGKKTQLDSDVAYLLNVQPNPEMTGTVFRHALAGHTIGWGNGYAEVEVNGAGNPIALWPLTPNRVTPDRTKSGKIVHLVRKADGRTSKIPDERVLHIPGTSFDGIMGYSIITMARESIGLGLAAERYGATYFGSGTTPATVLETEEQLGPEGVQNLRDSWQLMHQGVDRAHRVAILHSGLKYKPIFVPPEVSQFLQTRKFTVLEIARWFNIPPHMLMDLERATFSNIEHQSIEFVYKTMGIWYRRFGDEYRRKLIPESRRRKQKFIHDPSEYLHGDVKTRFEAWGNALQHGWLNIDEVRMEEDYNPVPGGKGQLYTLPVNQVPVDAVLNGIAASMGPVPNALGKGKSSALKQPQVPKSGGEDPLAAGLTNGRSLRAKPKPEDALKMLDKMPGKDGTKWVRWPFDTKALPGIDQKFMADHEKDIETKKFKLVSLVATQDTVDSKKVAAFIQDKKAPNTWQTTAVKGLPNDRPYIIQKDNINYILDGHNRLTAYSLLGYTRVKCYYICLDDL